MKPAGAAPAARDPLALLFERRQKLAREDFRRAPHDFRIDAWQMHPKDEMRRPHLARELLEALGDFRRRAPMVLNSSGSVVCRNSEAGGGLNIDDGP